MPAQLNHTIVWSRDRHRSSAFLAEILGLPPPRTFYHFQVVDAANGVSLDFMDKDGADRRRSTTRSSSATPNSMPAWRGSRTEGLTFWADPARSAARARSTTTSAAAGSTSKIRTATCSN